MRTPRIRLAFLDHSERNTVYFAWDAKDTEGNEYYITYRSGRLTVSGPDGVLIDRNDRDDTPGARDAIIAMTADVFDAELLESGTKCVCGFAYPPSQQPELCASCGEFLRMRRIIRLDRADDSMPGWLREEAYAPYAIWRAKDEYQHELWVLWSRDIIIFQIGDPPDHTIEPIYAKDVRLPDLDPGALRAVLEVELLDRYDLSAAAGTGETLDDTRHRRSLIFHGVRVKWRDGRSEMFRYPTRDLAEAAAEYQFIENAAQTRNAYYVGPRIDWGYLLFGWLFR
jgi:hypothetical protein